MTNLVDLDRALAEFLEDGPNTAPEAPVIAALAHARTTPRRPDPFAWLRSDAMAAARGRILGLRPSLVLAIAALVAASIGIAVVGSRPQVPAVVVPGPSTTSQPPSSAPTIGPSNAASSGPSRAPSATPFFEQIAMLVSAGGPFVVSINDTTGDLVGASSLQPGDGASVGNDEVTFAADPSDPKALIVTWSGTPCEGEGAMQVNERTHEVEVGRESCQGDALPLDRIVRLQFRTRVEPADWTGLIVAIPLETGPAPTPEVSAP
jgi:hypothetical protein